MLTSVAVPLLSRARADPDGGELYTQRLMTIALVGLLVATALAILAAPLLTGLYLSGGDGVVDTDLANHLAYLLLPQIFFYGMAALFGAMLNTKEKFGVPAWAPVANNLVVIGVGIALLLISADTDSDTDLADHPAAAVARHRHDGRHCAAGSGHVAVAAPQRIPVPLALGR